MNEINYGEAWGWQFNDGRVSGETKLYHCTLVDGKPTRVVVLTKKDFLKLKKGSKLNFKPCIPKGEGKAGWRKDSPEEQDKTKIQMDNYWDDKLRRL